MFTGVAHALRSNLLSTVLRKRIESEVKATVLDGFLKGWEFFSRILKEIFFFLRTLPKRQPITPAPAINTSFCITALVPQSHLH